MRPGQGGVHHKRGKRSFIPGRDPRRIVGPLRSNGASEREIEFLETHRVELDAFASRDLIEWIEEKLDEAGVKKVVPDNTTLVKELAQKHVTQ